MAEEWKYGTILKRADEGGLRHFPHHRLMYVGPGQNPHVFRALALIHTEVRRVNADPTVRWDYTRWVKVKDE